MKFNYAAMDSKGKEVTGVVESDTQTEAHAQIREMGYFPTSIEEAGKRRSSAARTKIELPEPNRQQWEYKVGVVVNGTYASEQESLEKAGVDGWELVNVIYHSVPGDNSDDNAYFFYFKRRKA